MNDEQIVETLTVKGALSRAPRMIPAMRAAMKKGDIEKVREIIRIIADENVTAEEALARSQEMRREMSGKAASGTYTTVDWPDGKVLVVALVERDAVKGVVTSLSKKAQRVSWSPADVVRMIAETFKKTGGV